MKTQKQQVKEHLSKHKMITSWEAIGEYRITRLSHYILLLRKEGVNIKSIYKRSNNKNYVEYQLKK